MNCLALLALMHVWASPAKPSDENRPPSALPAIASLFPRIAGWTLKDGPSRYGPDTLFEYIDGAADTFLQFDFEELGAATYVNSDKVEITADVYRHRDPSRAFGIYSQERPAGSKRVAVGIEGYAGDQSFELVVGSYYVKLMQSAGSPALLEAFAEKLAASLPGTREPPQVLACFPERGRRPRSEKLSARDFLGHAFLHDGYTAAYETGKARFRLFVIQGRDSADARQMLERYLAAAKVKDAKPQPEGSATLKDPLNGEVQLQWKGRWIWGAVDDPSDQRKPLVEDLGRKLLALEGQGAARP